MNPTLVKNKTFALSITLKKADGTVADVSGASQIKCAVIEPDHSAVLGVIYTAAPDHAGANWAQGVVIVDVAASDTATIDARGVMTETQVTSGANPGTYFSEATMPAVKGLVS